MTSTLNWLDVSAEQQRRVRDMIRLFEEPGTRDEIGLGPVRDAFSDLLSPGTSVIQTRARYFLFIPWHFIEAQRKGFRGQAVLERVENSERQLIERFRKAGFVDGLIGRLAGTRVKTLPSTIYWSGLERWGVLRYPMTPRTAASMAVSRDEEVDEMASRAMGAWHTTIPPAPAGFPNEESGGFDLTYREASWLQERIIERAKGTLLAHLVKSDRLAASGAPWEETATQKSSAEVLDVVKRAHWFSRIMNGASLLYNLLVSEVYEARGFTQIEGKVSFYRDALATWSSNIEKAREILFPPDWPSFWTIVAKGNSRIPPAARLFIESWVETVDSHGSSGVAEDKVLRNMVSSRVGRLRGGRSVLVNEKLLALWGGSSGANPLVYRWDTARQLVLDIQEGLHRAGT